MSKVGTVFTIAAENPPVPGCTVSMKVTDSVYHFALAANTNISAEMYLYPKLIVVADGAMEVYTSESQVWAMQAGDCLVTPCDVPVGMRTQTSAVYNGLFAIYLRHRW